MHLLVVKVNVWMTCTRDLANMSHRTCIPAADHRPPNHQARSALLIREQGMHFFCIPFHRDGISGRAAPSMMICSSAFKPHSAIFDVASGLSCASWFSSGSSIYKPPLFPFFRPDSAWCVVNPERRNSFPTGLFSCSSPFYSICVEATYRQTCNRQSVHYVSCRHRSRAVDCRAGGT